MPKTSPDHHVEETDLEESLDEEEFTEQLVLDNDPTVKVPRDRRTIRGELCLLCLEAMLLIPNIACLRDSNSDTCRRCLESI